MNLKNEIIIYDVPTLNDADISFLANNFGMVVCDFISLQESVMQRLKTLNPNILIFGYADIFAESARSNWTTIDANESWFLHTVSGHRICLGPPSDGEYVMDVNSGWRQYFVSYVNSRLTSSFNGVFADDVINQLSTSLYWGTLTDASTGTVLTSSDVPSSAVSNWHNNVISFLQYVKANIPIGNKVIVNTNEYLTNDYLNVTDGKMDESRIGHPPFYDLNTFDDLSSVLAHINAMASASATGKIFISENGATSTDEAGLIQNSNYCFAATMLGMNGVNCFIGYNVSDRYTYNNGARHMSTLSAYLGEPTTAYYLSQGVYMRDFTAGLVLFNPSPSTVVVNLSSPLSLNGSVVSSVTMNPRTGAILLSLSNITFAFPIPYTSGQTVNLNLTKY